MLGGWLSRLESEMADAYEVGKDIGLLVARIEALERKVAALGTEELEETFAGTAPVDPVDGDREEKRERLTLHYSYTVRVRNIGEPWDHKWRSYCTFSGYVVDSSGKKIKWNHVTIGFSTGCGAKYPNAGTMATKSDCVDFGGAASFDRKHHHWSGWVHCQRSGPSTKFSWKTKNC